MFDIGENEGFELIKVGEYEAYVSDVTAPTTINGKCVSNLSYKIRDDIDQEFKGREIKFDYFSDADNMRWKISSLAKALGFFEDEKYYKLVNGTKKLNFKSFEEFINACLNRPLVISVGQGTYLDKQGNEKFKNTIEKYIVTTHTDFTAPVEKEILYTEDNNSVTELPF